MIYVPKFYTLRKVKKKKRLIPDILQLKKKVPKVKILGRGLHLN